MTGALLGFIIGAQAYFPAVIYRHGSCTVVEATTTRWYFCPSVGGRN